MLGRSQRFTDGEEIYIYKTSFNKCFVFKIKVCHIYKSDYNESFNNQNWVMNNSLKLFHDLYQVNLWAVLRSFNSHKRTHTHPATLVYKVLYLWRIYTDHWFISHVYVCVCFCNAAYLDRKFQDSLKVKELRLVWQIDFYLILIWRKVKKNQSNFYRHIF